MKILYITYENVYRTAILQAMVVKPLSILAKEYNVKFTITSTFKPEELDSIYEQNKKATQKHYQGLVIKEFPKGLKKNQSVFTFIKDILPILRNSISEAKKADIIHCRGYGGAFIGMIASFLSGKPFIFDMRGTLPEETVEVGKVSNRSLKFKLLKWIEKLLIKRSDIVFTVSEKFEKYIKERFKKERAVNINNPADFTSFGSTKMNALNRRITFIYSGSMQVWHDPETTLNYFSHLYKKFGNSIYLLFCTNDIEKAKEVFKKYDIPSSAYELRSVPYNKMPEFYNRSNIAFCFIRNSFSKSICFPVKFSEYIASELFVLTNDGIGDLSEIVTKYNCGLSFSDISCIDQNLEKIAQVVDSMLNGTYKDYDRNRLKFLDWNGEGVARIYKTYLQLSN